MANTNIKVLHIAPKKKPVVKEISNSLEPLQHEVEGDIECVYPFEEQVGLIVNDEGKLNGMELNRALRDDDGEIYDIIAGPFLVVGLTEDNFRSLTDEEIKKYGDMYETPEVFVRVDGKIHCLPLK